MAETNKGGVEVGQGGVKTQWVGVERHEFLAGALNEADLAADPVAQFEVWFAHARGVGVKGVDEMTLATSTREGRPSARIVLLKAVQPNGLIFTTNYASRKGEEMAANPHAALCVWWHPLERQVRWEGRIEKVEKSLSESYFRSRPRDAQIGAWASAQSSEIASRAELEARVAELEKRFAGKEIPLPEHWGGYRVVPERVEFWQGRAGRLHDRLVYERAGAGGGGWRVVRLSP